MKRWIKREFKKIVIGYLLAFMPTNYVTTALTQHISINNATAIVRSISKSGMIDNMLFGVTKFLHKDGLRGQFNQLKKQLHI